MCPVNDTAALIRLKLAPHLNLIPGSQGHAVGEIDIVRDQQCPLPGHFDNETLVARTAVVIGQYPHDPGFQLHPVARSPVRRAHIGRDPAVGLRRFPRDGHLLLEILVDCSDRDDHKHYQSSRHFSGTFHCPAIVE